MPLRSARSRARFSVGLCCVALLTSAATCAPGDGTSDPVVIYSAIKSNSTAELDFGGGLSYDIELVLSEADAAALNLDRRSFSYEPDPSGIAVFLEIETGLKDDAFDDGPSFCFNDEVIARDLVTGTEYVFVESGHCEDTDIINFSARGEFVANG